MSNNNQIVEEFLAQEDAIGLSMALGERCSIYRTLEQEKMIYTPAEIVVLVVVYLSTKVNNAGFYGYFAEGFEEPIYLPEILQSLEKIGCLKTKKVVATAISALEIEGELTSEKIAKATEFYFEAFDEDDEPLPEFAAHFELLDQCDDQFYDSSADECMDEKLLKFIKENIDDIHCSTYIHNPSGREMWRHLAIVFFPSLSAKLEQIDYSWREFVDDFIQFTVETHIEEHKITQRSDPLYQIYQYVQHISEQDEPEDSSNCFGLEFYGKLFLALEEKYWPTALKYTSNFFLEHYKPLWERNLPKEQYVRLLKLIEEVLEQRL